MKSVVFILLWTSTSAYGQFSRTNRSINGTGETLGKNQCEIGARFLSCGMTDDLMISAPTLTVLTGQTEAELRRRILFGDTMRVTPALIIGDPFHIGARLDFGMDFGEDREHSVTLTAESDWADTDRIPVKDYGPDSAFRFTSSVGGEYDFYHRGNVAYIGASQKVPYIGYTWGWDGFYAGLITSNRSRFIPVPYCYWRF